MNDKHPYLQIGVYAVDGSAQTFLFDDSELAYRNLNHLQPATVFRQDRLTIADENTEIALVPPLITRIDLVTDDLSVWDFPFVLGAPVEMTEAEFTQGVENLRQWDSPSPAHEVPVFLDLEMLNGRRVFLWMQIVGGWSRLGKIHSLLKERHLVFGLRPAGIGILNLANLVRLSVQPEPPKEIADGAEGHESDLHARKTARFSHAALHAQASTTSGIAPNHETKHL